MSQRDTGLKESGHYRFGDWLRREIDRAGLTQAELARMTAIDPGMISHWTNGRRLPAAESCEKLADALGVPRDRVLELAGRWAPEPDALQDPLRTELADLAKTLPPSEVEYVVEVARWRLIVGRQEFDAIT